MSKAKPVVKLDAAGTIVDRYPSVKAAGKANGTTGEVIGNRCCGTTQETDGYQYRYEDAPKQSTWRATRAARAAHARETSERLKQEDLRKSGIPGIQRDSAIRLLTQGMDVLTVSNITGLGPERLGYMLSRIKRGQVVGR